jgi:hypothetical protein
MGKSKGNKKKGNKKPSQTAHPAEVGAGAGPSPVIKAPPPPVLKKLSDDDEDRRLQACELASQLVLDPDSLPQLINGGLLQLLAPRLLSDTKLDVRRAAAAVVRNLSSLGDQAGAADVCKLLVDSGLVDACMQSLLTVSETK